MKLQFEPFPELKTKNYLLRKLSLDDAPEIFFLRSDKEVLKYISKPPATCIGDAIDFINRIIAHQQNRESVMWGIVANGQRSLIGNICLWNIDIHAKKAEIGYSLQPDHHNQGIMHEVFKPVLNYAFSDMGARIIEAYTRDVNAASVRLLEKNGFTRNAALEREKVGISEPASTVIYTLENGSLSGDLSA